MADQDKIREPIKEKPFPNNPGQGDPVDPRKDMLDSIQNSFDKKRQEERETALAGDPALAKRQQELDDAYAKDNPATPQDDDIFDENDGAQTLEPMHKPEQKQEDPVSKFIVERDGKPMMKLVVNGEIQYADIEEVVRDRQKLHAGEEKLRKASAWSQQLSTEKAAIDEERRLLELSKQNANQQQIDPLPAMTDVDSFDADESAESVVDAMFQGTKVEAKEKLSKTLSQVRQIAAKPAAQPTVNVDEIVSRATNAAVAKLQQGENQRQSDQGWEEFKRQYPDVIEDQEAFTFADSLTETIELENPDFTPAQIMLAAGKRAQKLIVDGKKPRSETNQDNPGNSDLPANENRLKNKRNLTPIPQPNISVQDRSEEEQPQTREEAFLEMKKARNQAV